MFKESHPNIPFQALTRIYNSLNYKKHIQNFNPQILTKKKNEHLEK